MNLTGKTGGTTPFVNNQNHNQLPSQANNRTLGGSQLLGNSQSQATNRVLGGSQLPGSLQMSGTPSQVSNRMLGGSQLPGNSLLSGTQSKASNGSQLPGSLLLSGNQSQVMAQTQNAQAATVAGQSSVRSSSAVVSSPASSLATGSGSTKKGQNKNSNKNQSSGTGGGTPFKTMELAPAARRKKRKAPEKIMPEKVSAYLPENALYTRLVELEAKVDATLARKKTDIQESVRSPPCAQKTLRIYVFNTFANQPLEGGEKSSEAPTWTLKIIGNILEDGVNSSSGTMVHKSTPYPKFSSFFKKITIYLDQTLYPDNHVILWENSRSRVLHEGFEVKRKGDKEFTAIIRLEMNYVPEKFKLSAALTQALGVEVETRSRIMAALWHYVKVKKLQDPSDPAIFTCDPLLRKVFGEEKVKFAVASQKLTQHLSSLQPIHLEHKIKLAGNNPSGSMCYDVPVDVPFPLEKDMPAFLERMEKSREINDYDNSIVAAIEKINEHRQRRAFFLGFSQSPAEFINTLISSQDRDLKVFSGDAIRDVEKERRSDFFSQPWVEDAIMRYLNRKTASGGDAAGTT